MEGDSKRIPTMDKRWRPRPLINYSLIVGLTGNDVPGTDRSKVNDGGRALIRLLYNLSASTLSLVGVEKKEIARDKSGEYIYEEMAKNGPRWMWFNILLKGEIRWYILFIRIPPFYYTLSSSGYYPIHKCTSDGGRREWYAGIHHTQEYSFVGHYFMALVLKREVEGDEDKGMTTTGPLNVLWICNKSM